MVTRAWCALGTNHRTGMGPFHPGSNMPYSNSASEFIAYIVQKLQLLVPEQEEILLHGAV